MFLVTIKKAIILFFQCVLMKCFALVMWGEKRKSLLSNNVHPRKNPLSEIREQACVFCFGSFLNLTFFTSCYYYYEVAGGSCLIVLNETAPNEILEDFHL